MADYFIGDIQGCFDELDLLLRKLRFNHQSDHLYLVGDLIGRGPQAKETLDFLITHKSSIHPVLGNHDLHFLAISQGIKPAKGSDKYDNILGHPNLAQYIAYLRQLPLIINFPKHKAVMCHAGITPQWDLTTALEQASVVEKWLISDNYHELLTAMYDDTINDWNACNTSIKKAIFTINSLTRMRYCDANQLLDLKINCEPEHNKNINLTPWFVQTNNLSDKYKVIFGHWAALSGITKNKQFIALDTGCLWGKHLTAWHLQENHYFQQKSLQ